MASADPAPALPLASTSRGRASGKSWKSGRGPTRRTQQPSTKPSAWHRRAENTKKEHAVKALYTELKEEKRAELARRREVAIERKKAAEERERLDQLKANMSARKLARARRKMGRSKAVKG